jgi:hypothetical protein
MAHRFAKNGAESKLVEEDEGAVGGYVLQLAPGHQDCFGCALGLAGASLKAKTRLCDNGLLRRNWLGTRLDKKPFTNKPAGAGHERAAPLSKQTASSLAASPAQR